jgi:hypothetical protein
MENWGGNVTTIYKAARRLLITTTQNNSAVTNKINKSSLVAGELPHTVLQALYNKYWHTDAGDKLAATPQLSEFVVTDVDPTASTSEWYTAYMDEGARDCSLFLNDNAPYVTKQLKLLTAAGALSAYILTADDYLLCKYDGTYLIPLEIQDGSLKVTTYKLRGHTEHSKNAISFRLNEVDSMNDIVAIKVTGGYVTSDTDHYSLIDCVATVSSVTADGCTITVKRLYGNPLLPTVDVPVTGILYSEVAADTSDDSDDEAPAASENWVEGSGTGVYTWTETGVFTSGKSYTLKISHPRIDVATATITFTT